MVRVQWSAWMVAWMLVAAMAQAAGQTVPAQNSTPAQTPSASSSSGAGVVQGPGAQPGTYSLTVNSQIVVLDVVVTDKNGQPVDHLSKDDFTVYEDKVPQKVVSFDAAQEDAAAANKAPVAIHSTAELDKLEPEAPVSIIVLDEVTTLFQDEAFARYSLKKYLKTQGDMLSQPTMLVAVNLQKIMVLQDYTTSKPAILDALDHHFAGYNWQAVNGSWKSEQFSAAFASLMAVAKATAGHAGHKNMVWVGRGFPGLRWDTLPADEADQLQALIENCAEVLRNARVTLYAIDPAGLAVEEPATDEDGFSEDSPFGGQVDFDEMAIETGGQAMHGRNDVDNLIGTGIRDGESFYTIAYRPAAVTDTAKPFRNITVKMRNPSLKAVTRAGYFTAVTVPPPAIDANGKPDKDVAFDVGVAAQSLLVYDGLPLTIARDTADPDRFHLGLKAASMPWTAEANGTRGTDLVLAVESFDRKGKMLAHSARTVHVTMKAAAANGPDAVQVGLAVNLPTAPPAARVRFVVRSTENGKVGADNVFLIDRKLISDSVTGLEAQRGNGRRR
jgi:VWFA-related protein